MLTYIRYNGTNSTVRGPNLGTIQGSKCGPLFYDIYSNDLHFLCSSDENILFADDTCLVYAGESLELLVNHVNKRLSLIYDWCCFNKLSINPSKSEYILLTNKHVSISPQLNIGGNNIRKVECAKYLGVYIDHSLKYHNHISSVKTKLSRFVGISYRLTSLFNYSTAKKFYYGCVYPAFNYCIGVWGGVLMCTERANDLLSLQRRIVKNLFTKFYQHDNGWIFASARIMKFNDVYRMCILKYMHKIIELRQCPALRDNVIFRFPDHSYNTRNRGDILPPFPRVQVIKMNFEYQFITLWNNVPAYISNSSTIGIFKKRLIEYFLSSYWFFPFFAQKPQAPTGLLF